MQRTEVDPKYWTTGGQSLDRNRQASFASMAFGTVANTVGRTFKAWMLESAAASSHVWIHPDGQTLLCVCFGAAMLRTTRRRDQPAVLGATRGTLTWRFGWLRVMRGRRDASPGTPFPCDPKAR